MNKTYKKIVQEPNKHLGHLDKYVYQVPKAFYGPLRAYLHIIALIWQISQYDIIY